jgi:Transposase and inactivated derivatives
LIFIDESGANLSFCRGYARAIGGDRVKYACPYPRGNKYTMIGAISVVAVEAALYGEWSANGEIFLEFVKRQLVPRLSNRKVVIVDNVSFHKVVGVKEAIEATGAHLFYLPPYSPDLSPIELMWSKVKSVLKKISPRTKPQFKKAIREAFAEIAGKDLVSWFKHCGYNNISIN